MLRSIAGAVVGEVIGRKRGNGLLGAGIGLVATRIATRSVPGLLLVGGAIAAKTIYDMRKESRISGHPAPRKIAGPSDPKI